MKNLIKNIVIFLLVTWIGIGLANSGTKDNFQFKNKGKKLKTSILEPQQEYDFVQGLTLDLYMSNRATMGMYALGERGQVGLIYPRGSRIEHLFGAGPWIGAIVDTGRPPRRVYAVTTGYEGWSGPLWEMYGNPDGSDSFHVTRVDPSSNRSKRNCDDDGDGKVDEDELDGFDNDRDGLIDEDFGAVSEKDVYVSFSDIYGNPQPIVGHFPLGIKVWMRSYAWARAIKEPILPIEYKFINIGNRILDSVYVGFFADADVGPNYVGGYYTRNCAGYLPDVRTAYVFNPYDRPSTPIGFTVLGTPIPLDSIPCYTFQWYPGQDSPTPDRERYRFMSSCQIKPDEYPSSSDTRFHFAFGPFAKMYPNDTLKISVAIVLGDGISEGVNNLRDNAAKAIELYKRGFSAPPVPPSPCLRIIKGDDRVTLKWDYDPYSPECTECDPLNVWDDSSKILTELPDTHWRRRDPWKRCDTALVRCDTFGVRGNTGGRIFEGFRVWRSEDPEGKPGSYALLMQYDVDDDLPFEYQTGLRYELVDSNLVRGRRYWYSVTSFTIPGYTIVEIPDSPSVRYDTLKSPVVESDIQENAQLVILPFEPSYEVGKVKVVPNPYRTDVDYTYEAGGWEGIGRYWTEDKRVIYFIHLPPKCVIRIFSLSGDLISTIEHDDELRNKPDKPKGQEEWNLISQSGRAIASGIYLFTVDSDYGRQVGKFVIIR